ncbi:uncharacterized protein GLRG_02241 [Colletotrichum graminicola M1.001]|uniref:Uncharacterized protein n=1 Tax=Colletotrichum graminicola (strain M1.001 / M2 / FGSC 10212) TaxID=645133 RepID=E3Q858_COLGM|nr:uncharacterized protein GLRG_02241 [Colletotrichum graminicola M1.001]EFQ27070.1 hypothetical protein GLRG_02241 [Colletotrichum graminicola M1.001]
MAPVQAMNVTIKNSWQQLSRVILSIATSQLVPIDLKMTGITDKGSEERHKNPSRQQFYEAAKKTASTFNTSLAKTSLSDTFVDGSCDVESYSLTVSPHLHADTQDDEMFVQDLDRRLHVAYYTPKFLRKKGIRMEKLYEDCVPYLSHKDVRMATQRIEKRMAPRNEREQPYNEKEEGLHCFSAYV